MLLSALSKMAAMMASPAMGAMPPTVAQEPVAVHSTLPESIE